MSNDQNKVTNTLDHIKHSTTIRLDNNRIKSKSNCPICNGESIKIDDVKTINPNSDEILKLRECVMCKHWWIDPIPNQDYLLELYQSGSEFVVNSGYNGTAIEDYPDFKNKVRKYLGFDPTKIFFNYLEVGVGSGQLFKYMEKYSNLCYGVEPGNWKYKSKNIVTDISNIPDNISFDVIVIQDVLEHLENPFDMLIKLKQLANENCILICGFPNKDSKIAAQKKGNWEMIRPVGHLHFFSKKSLEIMARKSGWNSIEITDCKPGQLSICDVLKRSIHNPKSFARLCYYYIVQHKDQWHVSLKAADH